MSEKVPIRRLPTGVPGLDAVLGGGVPKGDEVDVLRKSVVSVA